MNRYTTNGEEGEILPNLLGITDEETLHNAEFEGFLMAEILFTEKLTQKTKFSVKYICDIHRTALKELYSFAGRFRSVNISKGGFVFPAGRFIPDSMRIFRRRNYFPAPRPLHQPAGSDKRHRQGTWRITFHPPLPGRQW